MGGCCNRVRQTLLLLLLMVVATMVAPQAVGEEQQQQAAEVLFDPTELLEVVDGSEHVITWFTHVAGTPTHVTPLMNNSVVSRVTGASGVLEGAPEDVTFHVLEGVPGNVTYHVLEGAPEDRNITSYTNITYHGYVNITALFLGFNNLHVVLHDADNKVVAEGVMKMSVVLSYKSTTDTFTFIIAVLVAVLYFFMGTTLNLQVVKGIISKPVGPIVGIFCQYILMPMIAFGLGLLMFPDDNMMRLGLFLNGSSPGGGNSNMWTHLLGGSLDLSIMMTTVSTICAFAAVPLWVLLMGPLILQDASFVIPYDNIALTVVTLIIPCGLGIILQVFYPKSVKYCSKILTPMSAFNIVFILTFGVYAYHYIFSIFTWKILLSGFLLPTLGYLGGMVLAIVFRLSTPEVIAISVETGVQNATIALIILQLVLSSPSGELAAVIPACSTLFTPLPLVLVLAIKKAYDRIIRSRSLSINTSDAHLKEVSSDVKNTSMASLENGFKVSDDSENFSLQKRRRTSIAPEGSTLRNGYRASLALEGGVDNPVAELRDEV
nr:ileal sodium/bile acid cotransporter-like [Cherax quadricarinatus]